MKKKFSSGRTADRWVGVLLLLSVGISFATTLIVIGLLGYELIEFFAKVSPIEFLFGTNWEPLLEPKSFGVLPLVFGTFQIVLGSMLIALPVGLLVAIYLSEVADTRIRSFVKPVLELLAGVPTVVFGFFGLTFVTPLLQSVFPSTQVFNAASGAIVVGIMILPMVASLSDDAIRSVPVALREAGYALGGTRFEVITHILVPASGSRIFAAIMLAISRAIGETMAVTLASGATPKMTLNPLESIQTMTAYIVQVSMGDTPAGGIEYLTCFAVAALLFLITLVMNIIGNILIVPKRH